MFAALRRFTILMVMLLEIYVLNIRPSNAVKFCVFGMVFGALIAAFDDLAFNLEGYLMVTISNVFSGLNGIYVKKTLTESDLSTYGLMFYSSMLMLVPAVCVTYFVGDFEPVFNFGQWANPLFVIQFILSSVMGFVLNFSSVLCTQHNSALTTNIVGCLKNVTVTYLGMFIGGDYIFSWLNYIGINISVFASLVYTKVTFKSKNNLKTNLSMISPEKEALLPQNLMVDV